MGKECVCGYTAMQLKSICEECQTEQARGVEELRIETQSVSSIFFYPISPIKINIIDSRERNACAHLPTIAATPLPKRGGVNNFIRYHTRAIMFILTFIYLPKDSPMYLPLQNTRTATSYPPKSCRASTSIKYTQIQASLTC